MKKKLLLIFFAFFVFALFQSAKSFPDAKLRLVFCDVGQGDAAYIRGPNGSDIVIDGGPDEKVLNCLGKYMPFYDRTIELVILSHPQVDHLTGLIEILKRYKVKQIIDSSAKSYSIAAKAWENLITEKKVKQLKAKKGQRIMVDQNLVFDIVWPEENFWTNNLNGFSTVVLLRFKNFSALFTGDLDEKTLDLLPLAERDLAKRSLVWLRQTPPDPNTPNTPNTLNSLSILKVPHHGSKNSLSKTFYEKFLPQLAVISVGKNSYGHPSPELLKLLNSLNIKTVRTDENGPIEIVSDGKTWSVWSK